MKYFFFTCCIFLTLNIVVLCTVIPDSDSRNADITAQLQAVRNKNQEQPNALFNNINEKKVLIHHLRQRLFPGTF